MSTDFYLAHPNLGGFASVLLPICESGTPLGQLSFIVPFFLFLDTLLGLDLSVPRMVDDDDAQLADVEDEEDWWRRWDEEEEEEEEEEVKDEERVGHNRITWGESGGWSEEDEEVEVASESLLDEQARLLRWVERKVEESVGVDGRACVQRFLCELHLPTPAPPPHPPAASNSTLPLTGSTYSQIPTPYPKPRHTSLLSKAIHVLFVPHGAPGSGGRPTEDPLEAYRWARQVGLEHGATECREAFHSCPLSLFRAFGGYV